jgi:hypothetical protein
MMREVWLGGTGKRTWQVQLVRGNKDILFIYLFIYETPFV